MGEPVKVVDLARDLIRLSGLVPDEDIEVVFTGLRPGEKLFEELSVAEESATKTRHPKIFIGHLSPHALEEVTSGLERLHAATSKTPVEVRAALKSIVPEFASPEDADVAPQEADQKKLVG
jgi:FlaA1/EpsC-like NDP-sugar epimerase